MGASSRTWGLAGDLLPWAPSLVCEESVWQGAGLNLDRCCVGSWPCTAEDFKPAAG